MSMRAATFLALTAVLSIGPAARADQVEFSYSGGGIYLEGTFTLATTPITVTAVSGPNATAYEITDISGYFSDTNIDVAGAITGLYQPVSYVYTPGNIAFSIAGNSYDDLYYPGGDSPNVCPPPDPYPFSGGDFDIFGVLFDIAGGDTGEIWSNGIIPPDTLPVYGAAVSQGVNDVDYQGNLLPTPEPGSLFLIGSGLLGVLALKRQRFSVHAKA